LQPTTTAATTANMAITENSFFILGQSPGNRPVLQAFIPGKCGRRIWRGMAMTSFHGANHLPTEPSATTFRRSIKNKSHQDISHVEILY
jgi:hypothetical protein